jgi:hypothetical protein
VSAIHAPAFIIRGNHADELQPGAVFIDPSRFARGAWVENDVSLAKKMLAILQRKYPGHRWVVEVKTQHGIAFLRNFFADPRKGFIIHLKRCVNDADILRETVRAGGELLERYGIERKEFKEQQYERIWRPDAPGVPKIIRTTDTTIRKKVLV